jgi:Abnormal spindle-like microcephaly-assoc'd, ASPM-SPD-2-Hydin/Immunoglobulin domain/Immunoglobulin I-set domain
MNSYTNFDCHSFQTTSNHRAPLGLFAIILALSAVLSLSGCVGLTGASTPGAKSNSTSASAGTLAASAPTLAFGSVATGSTSPQTLTLSNTGTATINISQATVTGTGFSVVGGMNAVSIAAGQNQAFQVQFAPKSSGSVSGSISIASDATNSPLTVSLSGTGTTALAITSQPENQSVKVGQAANFSVTASGPGTLTYQWKKNGAAITGATAASYTTPATTNSDNGSTFAVVVSDGSGSVTSNNATLTVTATAVAPSITAQPANATVAAGQAGTFSVTATGTSPLTYQWKKNGSPISGATSHSYTTPATTSTDNGSTFTVTVTNSVSSASSNSATLTVSLPPSISAQPASRVVNAGQTATFSVAATGTGTMSYQWKKNGAAISGATAASYTTPATTAADNGEQFSVTVTDTVSSVNSNAAMLTVNAAPSILAQPASQTVNAGQAASFAVSASGSGTLTYQWKKGGAAISGATSASYTTPATAASDSGAQFSVTVTNSIGSATSNAATLTVNVPPVISSQPASQTVNAGQAATFSVTASGSGTLTYQWKKNGSAISGATAALYTTPGTVASDNGASFTVTVTANSGNVTSNAATLTVNGPPAITAQPASKTVTVGQTATFSVAANGTGTLTYQWNKGGAAISGATSTSYTTPATTNADNGTQFTVTVSNSAGKVTSNAGTLTVAAAATQVLNASQGSLNFASVNIGSSSVLPVSFTNAGTGNVTISNVSISGAGYSASGVSAGQILTPGQSATLSVTFTPSSAGSLPGSVIVASNATNSLASVSLSGTGVQPVSHSVTLTWTASTSAVSGYNVYRSTVSGGPYSKVNSSLVSGTTYTDSTVQATQTYFYVVTSVDGSGTESAFSTEVSVTVP